ncbi:hypothetical protein CTAYLR_005063 [Chrysophaeum taylorii]|uniref:Cux N-terminal domain-containing protein n=1 Tax=Chrysophaeum taylorii TaxID=2483200 RepID=A0AAD7U9T8_9STRA|nr:hypothetical protein CTAYLR_005063 [Chrysophaeum taylorii]
MGEVGDDEELKTVSAFWVGFDLDGRRAELDARALEVADGKEASAEARKQLSRLTSGFRERYMPASARGDGDASRGVLEAMVSSSEEGGAAARRAVDEVCGREGRIWSGAVELLKAYQEELDALSRRARSSDSAFLSLYRSLYAAPDPANALRRAGRESQRARELGAENAKLATELKMYDGEFAQLKNQELKIRELEDALGDAERGADARAEERAEERAAEAEREAEARINAARERERGLERRLQRVLQEKDELEKRLATKLPPRGEARPREGTPAALEDVVAADASERAVAAEREAAMLRAMLKKSAQDQHLKRRRLAEAEAERNESRSALADSRREANVLRDENADLQHSVAALESALEDVRKSAADDRRELDGLRRSLAKDDPERTVDSTKKLLRYETEETGGVCAQLSADDVDDEVEPDPKLLQRRVATLETDVVAARDDARREKDAKDKLARENLQLVDKLRRSKSDLEAPDDDHPEKNDQRSRAKRTFPEKIAAPRHSAARRCAFLYVAALHFLVFAATIYLSHFECSPCHCGSDTRPDLGSRRRRRRR